MTNKKNQVTTDSLAPDLRISYGMVQRIGTVGREHARIV